MNKLRFVVNKVILVMAVGAGCTLIDAPTSAPPPLDLDQVVALFNADVGDEGAAVTRDQVEEAFREDPELQSAVQRDLADASQS